MGIAELAEAAGVSVRSVKLSLAGVRVGERVALKLADMTGIDAADLMTGADE